MITMKKYILSLIVLGIAFCSFAQDAEEKDEPVYGAFESGNLINQQTTVIPDAKTLEFVIQHKFGSIDNGHSDLWGIYSSANVRLGLNYVPVKNVQVGIGQTRKNMYTDLNAKWTILQQTQRNTVPVAVALYGSVAVDGRNKSLFGPTGQVVDSKGETMPVEINFSDRLSYFSELIVGRKFTDWFSLQAAASFTHYNMVGWDYDHDVVGAHINGRLKFSPQSSFIFNYNIPLRIENISEQTNWDKHAEPSLSLGVDISTFTHSFQIYIGNASGIIPQDVMMYNTSKFDKQGIALGFTITRLWMF